MDKASEFSVLELVVFDDLSCLRIESQEFTVLGQREDQIGSDIKRQNLFFVALITGMLVHLVPCDDLISFSQACVDKTRGCRLQACDLLGDEARHEDKAKLGRTEHIEGMLSNNCSQECVLATLVDAERHL